MFCNLFFFIELGVPFDYSVGFFTYSEEADFVGEDVTRWGENFAAVVDAFVVYVETTC